MSDFKQGTFENFDPRDWNRLVYLIGRAKDRAVKLVEIDGEQDPELLTLLGDIGEMETLTLHPIGSEAFPDSQRDSDGPLLAFPVPSAD